MKALLKRLALKLLDQPLRELIREGLAAEPLPSEEELSSLRHALDLANEDLSRLTDELQRVTAALDHKRAQEPPPEEPPPEELPAEEPPAEEPPSVVSPLPGCKIEGCQDKLRSRGFCSRHYTRWRRGRLEGFVGPDGRLSVGERSWNLDKRLAAEPYVVDGARLLVQGKVIGAL